MDSAKLKKLQEYSAFLTQQAEAKEARGESDEAIKDYVKLVDVLLLLANDAKDHPSWQQFITKAEEYQKKARSLAGASERPPGTLKPSTVSQEPDQAENGSSASRLKSSFRKFPSLIGRKTEAETNNPIAKVESLSQAESPWTKNVTPNNRPLPSPPALMLPGSSGSSQISALQIEGKEQESVPYSVYSKLLEEKTRLQREVDTFKEKEKRYIEAIEAKDRNYSDVVTNMVPKSEYELILKKLENSVPKSDYQQALAITSIPKERYIELQSQVTELELRLQNSVPRMIVDEIAEYVTFLVSMVVSTGEEKKQTTAEELAVQAPSV